MTNNLVFAHGFNVKDGGRGTLDRLLPYLERTHNILQADYGWLSLLGTWFYNDNCARLIAGLTPVNSVGVGHSNGCALLVKACDYGAKFKRLVLINPALDRDTEFPEQLDRIDVIHNLYDDTVTLSKWLPFHPWGEMGRVGYEGGDIRVMNHDSSELFGVFGHSAVLKEKAAELAEYMDNVLGLRDYCSGCGR